MTYVLSTFVKCISVSNSCVVVHMFCNVNQDGGQYFIFIPNLIRMSMQI